MPGQNLLIVENCEPVARLLETALAEHFPEVCAVASLAAARRHVRLSTGGLPGLVICSHELPDGTAEDFRRWIETQGVRGARRVPFVLIAGSRPGFRRSGDGFVVLSKPFLVEDLLLAIREARAMTG